ncbi:fasciclin-like arabinogalactan protein 14 [Raphanus sativus]|uniref:Fasciclin-like arabinogalactan protein 14 n=1 Tax=Raphanus sativus TaxID=3726 RepID=A0A9W3DSM9_RAPSA|nr:fasciclin-like arabinogalactan protein 14 [Raphanus sativus]
MSSSSYSSLTLFFLLASAFIYTPSNSFNITTILSQNKNFSDFNKMLSQTQLASTINSRQTITVLALSNDAMSFFSSQSVEENKRAFSLHVVLDYYDIKKLKSLSKKTALLTTLFQSSGQAKGKQGFINVTVNNNGDVMFGSAVYGSLLDAQLLDSVASEPFNISVLHISTSIPIMDPNNSDFIYTSSSPLPAQAPNDDDYEYDEPPSPPSSSAKAKAHAPAAAKAADTAPTASSSKANSTSSASVINSSQLDLAFAVVISSFWLFMTV